jgi:hypothetical protein
MFERQRHQALNRVGLSRLGGGRRWNVNVGVYDVVEEVGHPELHRERDDLEDLRVLVSGLPNRLKVGIADFAVGFRLPSSRGRRRCA